MGREETLSTTQIDVLLPERFELEYVGDDGQKHRPVVIHRGILGTMERMTAFLLENFAGSLPLWLSPVQVKVIPVSGAFEDYANEIVDKLKLSGISVEADLRNEKLGYKIRESQLEKTPYMFVVGENEMTSGAVSVRKRGEGDIGAISIDEAISMLKDEIVNHRIS
ncbi:Threonine--tRNA ligase 1 [compost metagenome]